jgi:hypothetical protein
MSAYRAYFRASDKICGREDFEADDDVAEIRIARVLYDACSDVCDCFELWQEHATFGRNNHAIGQFVLLI